MIQKTGELQPDDEPEDSVNSQPRSQDIELTVPQTADGARLDRTLAELLDGFSRARVQQLIEGGTVSIGGRPARKASQPVTAGACLQLRVTQRSDDPLPVAENIPLQVLFEDEHLAIIDKEAGMVVHPGAGNPSGTLVNALLYRFEKQLSPTADRQRPGIVHRLDRGTSGVMVVALSELALASLGRQFAERRVEKEYEALVYGHPEATEGVIGVPLGRDRSDRKKISPRTSRPRSALTRWHTEELLPGTAQLTVWPHTGRTHQVRAHLAHIRHPCLGDKLYAGNRGRNLAPPAVRQAVDGFGRPALHARRLAFEHPASGQRLQFKAERPVDLQHLLRLLQRWRQPEPGC